jgi:DNA transposition AAA+ family ATPase
MDRLWDWVDAWEQSQGLHAADHQEDEHGRDETAAYKTEPGMIQTKDLAGALGFCAFVAKHKEIGVVIGMPGTGKTTVAGIMRDKLPRAIKIEAWLSMRLGDLLDEIGAGLGLELRGTLNSRTQKIIRALKQAPDTVIIVDEAEYLKKWNVEKLDVLRKIHDNAGVAVLLFGTPAIANVLNRRDTTQLSRRMFQYTFTGARKSEITEALRDYNMDAAVAEHLAAIAADTAHGGRITQDTMAEAVMYKPGL